MTAPDTAPFIAQATPWSPATNGPVTGEAVYVIINDESDFDKYKGKLAGKIVLLGDMRDVPPARQAALRPLHRQRPRRTGSAEYATPAASNRRRSAAAAQRLQALRLRRQDRCSSSPTKKSPASSLPAATAATRRRHRRHILRRQRRRARPATHYKAENAVKVPVVVTAIENYGRVYRLLKAHVPVTLEMNVETKFTGDHEHGFDTVAEIPGTDPKLKDQIVMVGGHLDSWISGTGATDNGAGTIVAMEAVRILKALDIQPRRTIRIALWTGEEQGLFGSQGYVKQHFGSFPLATAS